jgi:hypothetical protein
VRTTEAPRLVGLRAGSCAALRRGTKPPRALTPGGRDPARFAALKCGPGPRHHDSFCRGARPRIRDASLRPGRSLAARTPARPPAARAGGAAGGGGGRRSGGGPARVRGSHMCPRRKCGVCVCVIVRAFVPLPGCLVCVSLCVRAFHCLDIPKNRCGLIFDHHRPVRSKQDKSKYKKTKSVGVKRLEDFIKNNQNWV